MEKELSKIRLNKEKVLFEINNVIDQVVSKKINESDFDLLRSMLSTISECYENKVEKYIESYRFRRLNNRRDVRYDWPEAQHENELLEPRMSECVKSIRNRFPPSVKSEINFFPSENKGVCCPQCVVLSTGDWEFGDTKFRNDILSYWYRCFYKNRFTLIFTESWQSSSWQKWKQLVDAYVAEQQMEINGITEDVNHAVVIIEYSEDGVQLRYCEKSV